MLSNSQKEHLTYTAIGQVFTLVIIGIVSFQYIFPKVTAINEQLKNTNTTIDQYQSTVKTGIDYDTLGVLLGGNAERAELIKIMQSDKEAARNVIKKPETEVKNYLDWLTKSIGDSDEDRNILKKERAKLNTILPTMSPISGNVEEDNITLKKYVKYIEGTILKQFNFDDRMSIGLQGVTFGGTPGAPASIGTLDMNLDFKGTNSEILRFIKYINDSGEPSILTNTGLLSANETIPEAMSNPLITMTSFSVQNNLDPDNPTGENTGRAGFRFYIRGLSKDDLIFLKANLKSKQDELRTKIADSKKDCSKRGPICDYGVKLDSFDQKYQQFERSLSVKSTNNEDIYSLTQLANTLKALEKELDTILPKDSKK